jgi:hypothetical protein
MVSRMLRVCHEVVGWGERVERSDILGLKDGVLSGVLGMAFLQI